MVTRQIGYHGPHFLETRYTNQRGLSSPTIFNVTIESVVKHWIYLAVEDRSVVNNGLGQAVGQSLVMLYMDNGLLGSWEP